LKEDPEEEMKRSQSSPLSKHKHKKDQQNLNIVPQKTTFDIEIQTMPEPKVMKEKNVQTRDE